MFQKVRQNLRPVLSGNAIRMPRYLSAPPGCPDIRLRPLRAEDSSEWNEVRWRNDEWLSPWESGDPMHGPGLTYNAWIAQLRRNEQAGTGVVFAIEHDLARGGQREAEDQVEQSGFAAARRAEDGDDFAFADG